MARAGNGPPREEGAPGRAVPRFSGDLAAALSALAMNLEDEGDLEETLVAIAHAAVGTVPGAEHASISMVRGRRDVSTVAATGDPAVACDDAQYVTGQGPCLDTLYEKRTAAVRDTAAEERWPHFAARAQAAGIRSVLSVQLFVKGDDLGALSLHSGVPDAFDEESVHVALLFATHAAVAIVGAEKETQLRDALSRRDVIGQAMGIVMERYGMTPQKAFSLLARLSHNSNRELFELAEAIVWSRDLPGGLREQ